MDYSISASIVLYKNDNSVKKTLDCLLQTNLPIQLFLIDNSPTNQLESELSNYLHFNNVHYIFNNKNIGFGAAHNIALKKIIDTSTFHLVLNPDVVFEPTVIPALLGYMRKNEGIGLVMPKVLYPDGSLQYLCKLVPTPVDLIFRRFLPGAFMQKRSNFFELRFTGYNKEMEVPYLSGCFMFLKVEALKKAGMFDDRFFMYPEDIDLTRRIHEHYKTMFYPGVHIVHEHGKGSYKSIRLLRIHVVNMIKYFNKWGWFFDKQRKETNKKILKQLL